MTQLYDRLCKRLQVIPNGCWEWQGYCISDGYGQITVDGAPKRVHRVMFEEMVGPIPEGMCVLHSCDNPPCANPAHLWLGTHADNMADRDAKGRQGAARGEKNGRSKLTWEQVEAIRMDTRLQYVIASDYGVSYQLISKIKAKKYWKEPKCE